MTVGVVGLGAIGAAVARAVAAGGFDTVGFDVRPEALDGAGPSLRHAATLAALAQQAEIVLIAVYDDAQVDDVLDVLTAAEAPPRIAVILSTVALETVRAAAARAAARGIQVLDSGVTGGERLRAQGKLIAMVGGDPEAVAAARPVLETFGDPVVHCGPLGAGMQAKLARNMITYGSWFVALEAARLAAAAGVEVAKLAEVCEAADRFAGGGGAVLARKSLHGTPVDAADREQRAYYAGYVHKDLRAAIEVAEELEVDVPAARLVDERFDGLVGL